MLTFVYIDSLKFNHAKDKKDGVLTDEGMGGRNSKAMSTF